MMSKQEKRNLIDELADRVREFLDNLESLLQPKQRKPARVPIPVHVPPPRRRPR